MIEEFVTRFNANKGQLESSFSKKHPADYADIVKQVIEVISDGDYGNPDPDRIHRINDGDWQGTLLFVVAGNEYQPSDYWYVKVYYGSCSGCDTLEAINDSYDDELPTKKQIGKYMTLALHIVQNLKAMQ